MKNTRINIPINKIILPFIITIIISVISFLYKESFYHIVRNSLIFILTYISYIFFNLFLKNSIDNSIINIKSSKAISFINLLDNNNMTKRENIIFNILVIIFFLFSGIFPLIPISLWVFPLFAYLLSLYSGIIAAFIYSSLILFFSSSFIGVSLHAVALFIYIIISVLFLISINKFNDPRNCLKYYLVFFLTEIIAYLMLLGGSINLFNGILAFINIIVSTVIIYLIHNKFYEIKVNERLKLYKKYSDWTFPLLTELKKNNPISYMRTIHISYFANSINKIIEMDNELLKAGSTYCLILSLFENDKEKLIYLLEEIDAPLDLMNLIFEVNDDKCDFTSNEAFVISLSKTLLFALIRLKNNDKNIELLYEIAVNSVITAYYNSKRLKNLSITFNDLELIKKQLISEKKYLKIICK